MRVIAGSARSLPLKTLEGMDTRPTTDRIKETLFNMIQSEIPGCRFLDLYAGSGAIAIEALSRGAKEAVLVENSKAACACIRENLAAADAIFLSQFFPILPNSIFNFINFLHCIFFSYSIIWCCLYCQFKIDTGIICIDI